jgi:phosphoribosylformylglycinamidine (FGAM) synthase-like amidotransferase family enzyme
MTFVELMEHPERALSTALKRSASQLNGVILFAIV